MNPDYIRIGGIQKFPVKHWHTYPEQKKKDLLFLLQGLARQCQWDNITPKLASCFLQAQTLGNLIQIPNEGDFKVIDDFANRHLIPLLMKEQEGFVWFRINRIYHDKSASDSQVETIYSLIGKEYRAMSIVNLIDKIYDQHNVPIVALDAERINVQ